MRKFLLSLLFCVSCASAAVVSQEEATETARGYSAFVGGDAMEGRFAGDLEEPFTVEADLDGTPIVLAYGFNYSQSGWILVAADDRLDPIAGFSHQGRIAKDDFENEASPVRAFVTEALLASYKAFDTFESAPMPVASAGGEDDAVDSDRAAVEAKIAGAKAKRSKYRAAMPKVSSGVPVPPTVSTVSDLRVPTLMVTKWAQSGHGETYYTDSFISNSKSGCTQTAMGQIFYYLRWPASAPGKFRNTNGTIYNESGAQVASSYSVSVNGTSVSGDVWTRGGDGNGGAYQWDQMFVVGTSATESQKQAMGALLYDIGIANGADYCNGSTAAFPSCLGMMAVFGYANMRWTQVGGYIGRLGQRTSAQEEAWFNAVHANLDAKIPVQITGYSAASTGHAVVADGYGYMDADPYYHINYGWASESVDGFYQWNSWSPYSSTFITFNIFTNEVGEVVSGRVAYPDGTAIANVPVNLSWQGGSKTAMTDSRGIWAAVGVPSDTTFTISPTLSGYSFNAQTVQTGNSSLTRSLTTDLSPSCGDKSQIDFTATSTTKAVVTGRVTINGRPFAGATVRFGSLTTTTSALGQYGFEVNPGTTGSVSVDGFTQVNPSSVTISSTVAGQVYGSNDFDVVISLAEAVDQPGWVFETSPACPWTIAFDQKCTIISAVSAVLGDDGVSLSSASWLRTQLTGPGTLTFKALPRATPGGNKKLGLTYWYDGGATNSINGFTRKSGEEGGTYFEPSSEGWKTYTVNIPAGQHYMNWQVGPFYMNDVGLNNCAWIDEITWSGASSAVAPAGTVSVGSVQATSATATLNLSGMGKNSSGGNETTVTATFRYGTSSDLAGASTVNKTFTGTGSQTISLTGLATGTKYYYNVTYAATESYTTATGSFTPVSLAQAPAGTVSATATGPHTATATLQLTGMGKNSSGSNETSVTATFRYGTSSTLAGAATKTEAFTGNGTKTISLTGLTEGATYYYAVTYAATESYTTDTKTFVPVSLAEAPAGTVQVGSVTMNSATATLTLSGMGKNESGAAETSVTATFRYGTSSTLAGAATKTETFTGNGSKTVNLTDLADNTTYYYAVTYTATMSHATDTASFTTLTASAPALGTPVATVTATNGTAATLSVDVTAVATMPATLTLTLNGAEVKSWDVTAPGTFSFPVTTVPYSTNSFVFTSSAAGKTMTKNGSFVAKVYADWFTVRFTGVGEKDDDGGVWTAPGEGSASIVSTNGVYAYALDGVDALRYAPSHPSEKDSDVEVSGTTLVSVYSTVPTPPASAKIGFAFVGSPIAVHGFGASGWTALSGSPALTEGVWVSYRIAYDFDAGTATVSVGGQALAPALPLPAGVDSISAVGFAGDGAVGDFRGRCWMSESSIVPVVLPDHVDFTTDGTGIVLSDTTFSLNIADPVKGATYTVLTNATLTGEFHPAYSVTFDSEASVLPLPVTVDPSRESLFAKVVVTIGPYSGN